MDKDTAMIVADALSNAAQTIYDAIAVAEPVAAAVTAAAIITENVTPDAESNIVLNAVLTEVTESIDAQTDEVKTEDVAPVKPAQPSYDERLAHAIRILKGEK